MVARHTGSIHFDAPRAGRKKRSSESAEGKGAVTVVVTGFGELATTKRVSGERVIVAKGRKPYNLRDVQFLAGARAKRELEDTLSLGERKKLIDRLMKGSAENREEAAASLAKANDFLDRMNARLNR